MNSLKHVLLVVTLNNHEWFDREGKGRIKEEERLDYA